MEDKKKIIILAVVIAVALIFALMNVGKSVGGEKLEEVGSLEGGVNKATGLPLNPPPAGQELGTTTTDPSLNTNDPSLPSGN